MKRKTSKSEIEEARWRFTKLNPLLDMIRKVDPRTELVVRDMPLDTSKKIESCYLFGKVGTGKSVKAAHMLLEWSLTQAVNGNTVKNKCLFVSVNELIEEIKDSYSSKDFSKEPVLLKYKKADMLVLDDIGTLKITDWVFQSLYTLIAYRYSHLKTTLYTSNLSLDQLDKHLQDDRLVSRIMHDCKGRVVNFEVDSFR